MEVIEFKLLDSSYSHNNKYVKYAEYDKYNKATRWSTPYEYSAILSYINKYMNTNSTIYTANMNELFIADLTKNSNNTYNSIDSLKLFDFIIEWDFTMSTFKESMNKVSTGGYFIGVFNYNSFNIREFSHYLSTKLKYPSSNNNLLVGLAYNDLCGILVVKKHPTISVVLDSYLKSSDDNLIDQIKSMEKQTIKPAELFIFTNNIDVKNIKSSIPITVFNSTDNRVSEQFSKFYAAFNCVSKYVAFFDNNTIPNKRWFENCLNSMAIKKGLYGAMGYKFTYNGYEDYETVGYVTGNDLIEEVDIIDKSYFLKKSWLKYFVNDLYLINELGPSYNPNVHMSHTLKKYGNILSYVPPHPMNRNKQTIELYGNTFNTFNTYNVNNLSQLEYNYKLWVYTFFNKLVKFKDIYDDPNIIGPFKYSWAKLYNKLRSNENFCFIRIVDGEMALMLGNTIGSESQAGMVDKWTWINNNGVISQVGKDLLDICKNKPDPNIYYAYATTDCVDMFNTLHLMLKPALYSIKNIFYANQFINSNYKLTDEFIFRDLLNGVLGNVVIICNEGCKDKLENDIAWKNIVKDTMYFPNDIVTWWETNYLEYRGRAANLAKKYNNTLYIFCVGPLSKVLINIMWKSNCNNKYVDFGSAFDLVLKDVFTRGYQIPGNFYYNHSDQAMRVLESGIEILDY
jgi:hypothetical protein